MGKLVPAKERKETGRGKVAEDRQDISVDHRRLSEFRKLAAIPEEKFQEKINDFKDKAVGMQS